MMGHALLALGLLLLIEGLAYALAPSLVERMLVALSALSEDARRLVGLTAMVGGAVLIWLAKAIGT